MARKYHGWIYREKDTGSRERFYAIYVDGNGNRKSDFMGIGEVGAVNAVDLFEKTLNLGQVKLEETPLGLRVFTLEKNIFAEALGAPRRSK